MISVGIRDARKGQELGFGAGREMEDTELEEGEACSSHVNEYEPNIDPDVSLSYIGDRLHDVLGHFQKDFEDGVVSAENLGPKFGGYGSFLPSHQRSPVWSQPRTSPKGRNYSLQKSPNNVTLEGGQRNNVVCHTTPQSMGLGPASTGSTSLVAPKAPPESDQVKQEVSMLTNQSEQYALQHESANKKAITLSDQKSLKVRIKVGSDNLSTRKNAIYSGLGLDGTLSSSLDDSPSDSEGVSQEPQDVPFESPTSILQIMTSSLVHESMMSPLPDDLIYLIEKEKFLKEGRPLPLARDGREKSSSHVSGTHTMEGAVKVSGLRKMKSVERNDHSAESKSGNNKDGAGLQSKKEHHIDTIVCDELVSKTSKLPPLSNSCPTVNDMTKSKEMDKENALKDKVFPGQAEDEPMESKPNQEDGWVEKRKENLAGKVQEDRRASSSDDVLVHPLKEGRFRGENPYESLKGDLNVSKGREDTNTEIMDHSKQEVNQKATPHEIDDIRLLSGKECPSAGEKKKLKESQRTVIAEVPKESSRVGSSSATKMKRTHVNNSISDPENFKLSKDIGKSRDTCRDFFGDTDVDNQMDLFDFPTEDKLRDSDGVAKSIHAVISASRERPSGKMIDKQSTSDSYPLTASNIASRPGNGPIFAPAPATRAPALIEDNWVCCDKCQKWRLLPHGTNPDNLPDKWLCTMLNWLPGMNRCSISEEETTEKTKALLAQYQVPAPESQTNLPRNPSGFVEGVALPKSRNPDQNPENFGLPSAGKKKNGMKELSNVTNKDGSIQLPNSMKKNRQASVKSRSLNDMNQSPLLSEPDLQQLSKSSDMAAEKRNHREKPRILGPSTGGDTKNLKSKSRRDSDSDSSRASKKIKTEAKHVTVTDEDWASDYTGMVGEAGRSPSSGFLTAAAEKDQIKNRPQVASVPEAKDEVFLGNRSLDVGNCGSKGSLKKRKMKEFPDSQIHMGSLPDTVNYIQDHLLVVKEEFSDNDHRKEKKVRSSKSDGKESSASKGSGRIDKKSSHSKNQQLRKDANSSLTHRSSNGMDSLKKELGPVPMAATSSSSKVSGSQKTKSSFQEVKGSPVESVSSSPMRILNSDKLTSVRRDLMGKDESQDAGDFAIGTPRRCSAGEDDGGSDRSGTARKEKMSSVAYHRPLDSSVLDSQDRDSDHISGGKARGQVFLSPDITNRRSANGALSNSGQDTLCPSKPLASNQFVGEDRQNGGHYHANGSRPRKSGKGYSSSRSKDKNGSLESDLDMGEAKNSNAVNEVQDHSPSLGIKHRDGKNRLQEKFGPKTGETTNKYVSKKDFIGKPSNESRKREGQSYFGGHDGQDVRLDATCKKDAISSVKQNPLQDYDSERSSRRISSEKSDRADTGSARGKSLPLQPSGGAQSEMTTRCPRPATGSHKSNGADTLQVDASEGNDAQKVQIQNRKADSHVGTHHISSRHLAQNGHKARDLDASSPVRRDSGSQAVTSALKEAKDLKHLADRVKNSGSVSESTGLYFQAAIKFLHALSLSELANNENAKHSDMTQCMSMYRSTAKLCEFCAHEYEKAKDMAAAALAYKCMEVAYMRVIYSSHPSASRDRLELQTALQMVPPGESPSSSASDVDNVNNPSTGDKVALPKGGSSPQVAGNHVIAARNRPNFMRMLNYAQDVISAMEASRKSRFAFAAATTNVGDSKHSEGISFIKRALDFNFQDVEGLLRLVKLAMDAISR